MKRTIVLTILAIATCLFVLSCTTQQKVDVKDIPDFYLNPPMAEDAIYGVGDAKMSSLSMSKTMATSRARDDVARQIEVSVKNAITDYAQEAGEGNNNQAIQFAENVSRQIVDITLKGVKTKEIEVAQDGTVYVLVEYSVNQLLDSAEAEFKRNDAAAFAEFKADEALEMLNAELQNNPPQAGGSDE